MVGETLMRELQSKEQLFDKERQKLTERFKTEIDAREEAEKKIHVSAFSCVLSSSGENILEV